MSLFKSETDIELRVLQLEKFMYMFGNDIEDWQTAQIYSRYSSSGALSPKIKTSNAVRGDYDRIVFDNSWGLQFGPKCFFFKTVYDEEDHTYTYHNLFGPSVISFDGKTKMYYINDKCVNWIFPKWLGDRGVDLNNLTDEDKMIIEFEWGNYGK